MRNQFVYTVTLLEGTPEEPVTTSLKASFNTEKIVRTISTRDGGLVVLLDDFHEHIFVNDTINTNTNKLIKNKREKETTFSEITLSAPDAERFFERLSIDTL